MILKWPTDSRTLTQRFLERPNYYNFSYIGYDGKTYQAQGHEGVDIVASYGSPIRACANGVVSLVRLDANTDIQRYPYGNQIRIKHNEGFTTIYAHLERVIVKQGDVVKVGDVVGFADSTGNSTGSHLHLTVKKKGFSESGGRPFMNDIVDPLDYLEATDTPDRHKPDFYLRGLHGDGAADWMLQSGTRGWATEVVYSHGDLTSVHPMDFRQHEASGIRVIVRWNYSYASSDGGLGTYPKRADYDRFIDWCCRSILACKGAWGHIIGNEPNRAGERPDYVDANNKGTPIMPGDVAYIYNAVWNRMPTVVRVSPPAIDPTNIETLDPKQYFKDVIANISGAEFFALHAYSYGVNQPVNGGEKFAHMTWQYHSFRMWEPLAAELWKDDKWRKLPLIITETNHLHKPDGTLGWDSGEDGSDWIKAMYDYVLAWNRQPGDQYVHGVCLYRYNGDDWRIDDKPMLLDSLRNNGEKAI
jgi:peptidase M23-like protein